MPSSRVLVVMKGYIGDAVMALPLLDGLRRSGLATETLIERPASLLLRPRLREIPFHEVKDLEKPATLLRHARDMRRRRYDVALLVNRSFRSALLTWLAGIPRRIGHATEGRSFLMTRSIPYDEDRNEAESYLDLARAAGYELPPTPPELRVTAEEIKKAGPKLQGATIGLQPGARHPWKQIPIPVLAATVDSLQAQGHKVALFGGEEERAVGQELAARLANQPLDLVGQFPLEDIVPALASLRLMVGGDTGLMHVAAAAGCPTVTAFGPTNAKKWGHFDPPHQVVDVRAANLDCLTSAQLLTACQRALQGAYP